MPGGHPTRHSHGASLPLLIQPVVTLILLATSLKFIKVGGQNNVKTAIQSLYYKLWARPCCRYHIYRA